MSNKNPFEIRSEMLQLAKEYMDQQQALNMTFAENMVEAGRKTAEEMQQAYQMYSMEDLMEKAKEMYSFVSKKD
jgi:urease gamma subunit